MNENKNDENNEIKKISVGFDYCKKYLKFQIT